MGAAIAASEPQTIAPVWRFNRDYDDVEQVAPFLPDFLTRLAELEAAGQYRYNDSFRGSIPGIAGPDEDRGIYLLQGLERQRAQDAKVAELLARGYERVETLDGVRRFAHVVLYPTRRGGGEWAEYRQARLVPRNGGPYAVLPKGKRTNGYSIGDRAVLVSNAG